MTTTPGRHPISAIQRVLEQIPGAIRHEPLSENSGGEVSPAQRVWIHDPAATSLEDAFFDGPEIEETEDRIVDDPPAFFEIPPSITQSEIREILGEELITELQRKQQIRGIDALGWYVTFHQKRFQHGVHIPIEGVATLALSLLDSGRVNLPIPRMMELSYQAILRHELFHFETDCMTANWELSTGSRIYWDSQERLRNASGYIEREEALANSYMLRGFKHPTASRRKSPGMYQALKSFCESQPSGYCEGPRYVSRDSFLGGCRDLSMAYQHESSNPWSAPPLFDALLLYNDPVRIDWTRCPIIVSDENDLLSSLGIQFSYFQSVSYIKETPKFQREMSKLSKRIQDLWRKRKEAVSVSTSLKSLDFKRWKPSGPDWYSMRIDGDYRVHLRHDRRQGTWIAESVGTHKEMRHD